MGTEQEGRKVILVGLGSNVRHGFYGPPAAVIKAAVAELEALGFEVVARSHVYSTVPMGPRQPRFANAAVGVRSNKDIKQTFILLKKIEQIFGRKRGKRWGPRVLDLDILAAGRTRLNSRWLTVPHAGLAARAFVLLPLVEIAPDWRHPATGLTPRYMLERLGRQRGIVRTIRL